MENTLFYNWDRYRAGSWFFSFIWQEGDKMKRKQICLYIYICIYLYTNDVHVSIYIPMTYMYLTCLHCYTILILNKLIEMLTEIIFFFFWKGVQNIIRFKSFNCQLFSLVQGLTRVWHVIQYMYLQTRERKSCMTEGENEQKWGIS